MGKIIKVGGNWTQKEMDRLTEELRWALDDDAVIVRDSEMEVFEYDDLDNVTVHVEDIREELGIEETPEAEEVERKAYFKVE